MTCSVIGKYTCIMGGRMPFAPTIIREIQKSLKSVIQNQALGGIFILKPDEMNDLTAMNAHCFHK